MKEYGRTLLYVCLIAFLLLVCGCGNKKPAADRTEKPSASEKKTASAPKTAEPAQTESSPDVTDLLVPGLGKSIDPLGTLMPLQSPALPEASPAPEKTSAKEPKQGLSAQNVMAAMQKTYRSLKSLRTEGTSVTSGKADGKKVIDSETIKVRVAFARPDKIAIRNNDGGFYSDGKTVYNYIPETKGYIKGKANADIVKGLISSSPGVNVMGLLYGADYSNTIASIKLLPETRIGSRDVYALSIKFKDGTVAPRGTHISQTLWVGKSDMALYKTVTMLSAKPKPRKDIQGAPPKLLETTITTIVSKYEPNPTLPANTFAFKPPAGSKEINQQPEVLDLRGKQVPNFAFEWTTGEQKSLSDFKGRILLLDFISLPMCESQLPVLKKVNDNMGDRAQLIVVNVDRDEAQVRSYLKEKGYDSLPVVFLNESSAGVIGEGYRLVGLPIMYFVDENGVVRGQAMGVPSDKQIEEKLNEVMSR